MSLEALFQTGDIAILIAAAMLVEAIVLARYFKRFPGMIAGLAAGACLVLALHAALLRQEWTSIALFLSLSFFFHVLEILQWLRLARNQPR